VVRPQVPGSPVNQLDPDRALAGQCRRAADDLDPVGVQQRGDTAGESGDDLAAEADQRAHVEHDAADREAQAADSSIACATSAPCSIALVGMQPQFAQTPPSSARSMTATRRPCWAARIAAT
jgi:hypothetical protein